MTRDDTGLLTNLLGGIFRRGRDRHLGRHGT